MVLECCEEKPPIVPGYEWKPLEGTKVYHFFDDAATRIEEEINIAIGGVYSEKRASWERPGWFLRTISLLEGTVGSKVVTPVTIYRASPRGAVFTACTSAGNFFLKCSPACANDASRSEAMAKIAPEYCSMPLYVEKKGGTMIIRDYGKSLLAAFGKSELQVEVNTALAFVQQRTIGKTDDLLNAGFMDARLEVLSERFEDILNHSELFVLQEYAEHHTEHFEDSVDFLQALKRVRKYANEIKQDIEETVEKAMAFGIPATVVHNDLYSSNVCRNSETGNLAMIDWELGCISHPFMDQSISGSRVKRIYFEKWQEYGTAKELEECSKNLRRHGYMIKFLTFLNIVSGMERHAKPTFVHLIVDGLISLTYKFEKWQYSKYSKKGDT